MCRSAIKRPHQVSVTPTLAMKNPTKCCLWISVFLLLIFIQMITSLLLFPGVFIASSDAQTYPFKPQDGKLYHLSLWGAEFEIITDIVSTVVFLGLYAPVVLVAFALLAVLLTAYAKDKAALWFSMACQAASSLLILTGIIAFLVLNHPYVTWEDMTLWFYVCVGVQVELDITTVLTWLLGRRLTSDWK